MADSVNSDQSAHSVTGSLCLFRPTSLDYVNFFKLNSTEHEI